MISARGWACAVAVVASAFPAGAQAQTPAWSLEAQQRLQAGPNTAQTVADRLQFVQQAEEHLARGDTAAAQQSFERAAMLVHAADVEMGLVRTYQQAGEYRRALGFAAHAAGAHRDTPAAAALYGWLLHIGGQRVFARRVIDDALALWPGDRTLQSARWQIDQAWPTAGADLMTLPLRAAPYASGAIPSTGALVVGSAVLAANGNIALAPAAVLRTAAAVWVRNGLGQTVVGVPAGPAHDPRLTVLRLSTPLPLPAMLVASIGEPYAGSPGYAFEYSFGGEPATAAWPLLRQGFFGRGLSADDRLLGIDSPPGPRGGPVFDNFGRLVGVAVPHPDGRDRLVPAASLAGEMMLPSTSRQPTDRPGADAVYENALRVALQLLVSPQSGSP